MIFREDNMIARLLKPEESWRWNQVMAAAFEWDFDLEKARAEAVREKTEEELREQARNRCFGALSDDGKILYGCVNSREYTCRFDGGAYKLGGIGGVSTLPPYRHNGAIRASLSASLRDMYENGFTFSYLYPFSTQYYRKFGYEVGAEARRWVMPLADIRPKDVGGTIEQIFPGDDFSPLLEVYDACFADCNMSAVRDRYDAGLEKAKLMEEHRYVYVWRNEAGAPRGLMIAHKTREDGAVVMDCNHTFGAQNENGFLFCDMEALSALLFFVKSAFSADYDKISFTTRREIDLTSLVGENNSASCSMFWNGMLRVVNVRRVLENCNCRGTGCVRIAVEDTILPENCGTWKLTFAPGQVNFVEKTEEQPDVSLTINAFSALICGARDVHSLAWIPDAVVHNAAAPFAGVFYAKPCFMLDLF
jgi:hypothetical protein